MVPAVQQEQAEQHSAAPHPPVYRTSLSAPTVLPPSFSLQLCLVNSITSTASSLNSLFFFSLKLAGQRERKKKISAFFLLLLPLILDEQLWLSSPPHLSPAGCCALIGKLNPNQKGLLQSHLNLKKKKRTALSMCHVVNDRHRDLVCTCIGEARGARGGH